MTAYPAYFYRDPDDHVKFESEKAKPKTCEGCTHLSTLWGLQVCSLKDDRKPGQVLRRCEQYKGAA